MKPVCISDTHSLHRQIPEIPYGEVLITHSQPHGIADQVDTGLDLENTGCRDLLARVR